MDPRLRGGDDDSSLILAWKGCEGRAPYMLTQVVLVHSKPRKRQRPLAHGDRVCVKTSADAL